jgi:hypothetical protein
MSETLYLWGTNKYLENILTFSENAKKHADKDWSERGACSALGCCWRNVLGTINVELKATAQHQVMLKH